MANKKITDVSTITSMAGTDKLFVNSGGDLKQIALDTAVANSTPVQTLNSNLGDIANNQLLSKAKLLTSSDDLYKLQPGIYRQENLEMPLHAPEDCNNAGVVVLWGRHYYDRIILWFSINSRNVYIEMVTTAAGNGEAIALLNWHPIIN